ncbi:hypothetical protein J1614_005195 [Plenodomus biglobosus]|nr:hypothetical protein J1614_005195 [Plenodomus biglobosus]
MLPVLGCSLWSRTRRVSELARWHDYPLLHGTVPPFVASTHPSDRREENSTELSINPPSIVHPPHQAISLQAGVFACGLAHDADTRFPGIKKSSDDCVISSPHCGG